MRPDVLGINCATGPAEMQEHLRYLSASTRPLPISVLPNAGLPSVVDGRTHYDLTPEQLADVPPPPRRRPRHRASSAAAAARRRSTCSQVVEAVRGVEPCRAHAGVRAERDVDLQPGHARPGPQLPASSASAPTPTARRRSATRCSPATGTRARRSPTSRSARAPTSSTSASTTSAATAPPTWTRSPSASPRRRACRSCSTPPSRRCSRPALQHIGGRAILNSANLEDGELPGSRMDRVFSLAREYGAAVICLLIDERGQARDVEWKMEIAHRIHEIATERYGLSLGRPDLRRARRSRCRTGDDDLRRDAMETMEAIRRIKAEIPGAFTDARRQQRQLRPLPGRAPRAEQRVPPRVRRGRARLGDRPRRQDRAAEPSSPRSSARCASTSIYDRRRPAATADGYDPLQQLLEVFADVKSVKAVKKPTAAGWPVEERLKHRIIDGDREGLTADLDEALAGGIPPLTIVNDVLLDGMKVVGELFGSGQMQLPFVLQSAETMKASVAYLEPHMERVGGDSTRRASSSSPPSRATCTTSARTSSTSSARTTATRSTTSASRCRSPTWWPRSRRSTPTRSG